MEFRLGRIGPNTIKQLQPPCACCGYDAEWIVQIVGERSVGEQSEGPRPAIERMFCERDMRDALLDAINFPESSTAPDSPESC